MTKNIDTSELIDDDIAMHGRKFVYQWQQNKLNVMSFKIWRHLFESVALSTFEWEGLPDLIDPRYMEICLLHYGMGGFFEMRRDTGMFAFAQATPLGNPNMYYNPNQVQLIPPNGINQWVRNAYYHIRALKDSSIILERPDAIVCYDNIRRAPMLPMLRNYAMRLARIDRICDQNFGVQATPYIINTLEERSKDAANLIKSLTGFEPAIIQYKTTDGVKPEVLNLNAPYVADKLLADGVKILNQALTLCGVDNANTEKRERMLDGEASSNDELVMLMRRSRAMCRKQFAKQVNDRYGLNISCHYAITHTDEGRADMSAFDAEPSEDDSGSKQIEGEDES
jgi:hypothetical protein